MIHQQIKEDGWALLPSVIPDSLLRVLQVALDIAYIHCKELQEQNGLKTTTGTVHHLPVFSWFRSFRTLLDSNPAAPHISRFFGGKPYILNSMGGNFNFPDATNYAAKVHRDIRSWSPDSLMLNTLVTLDDMTKENGATWLLPDSHWLPEKPTDEAFDKDALQIEAPVGSILLWDSRLWHRAGVNRTDRPRRILTPIYTKPFFKQGLDYPRALGYDRTDLSDNLRQILGYKARTPASLEEWYRLPAERFYQADQG